MHWLWWMHGGMHGRKSHELQHPENTDAYEERGKQRGKRAIAEMYVMREMYVGLPERSRNPEDDFRNAYRIFQGLSYKDIERQYGAIVKLLSLGANLFCVFEHGCAIIPINEKALIATSTGQAIHMYGSGVLQNQVTPISPDYGSI